MPFTPFNSLHAFVAVARTLSFAAAAREIGVSTSALSQAVRQLEERLNVTLFARTSRSVALTEAGQRLFENAEPALEQAVLALDSVKSRPGTVTGRVRLTVPTSAIKVALNRMVPQFIATFPGVEVDVHVNDEFEDIIAGGSDAGIRLVEAIDLDMVHVRLSGPGRLVVAGAPSYFERRGIPTKPEDLLQHDCICTRLRARGKAWAWELERGKRTWRIPVRGPLTTNNFDLMLHVALKGGGLVYSSEGSIEQALTTGKLRVVLDEYACAVPGLFLYFPNRKHMSPALRAFVDFAKSAAGRATRGI